MHTASTPSWEVHGALRVSDDKRYLAHKDGMPFNWVGDTAWRLASLNPEQIEHYFATRAEQGFTIVQVDASNMVTGNFEGERLFEGGIAPLDGGTPLDKVRLNEKYWKHFDHALDVATKHGFFVVLFSMWASHAANPELCVYSSPDEGNLTYGRLLADRYCGRPNIIWCACGEYDLACPGVDLTNPQPYLGYIAKLAEGIAERRGPDQLMTIHPYPSHSSSLHWHDEPWVDFNMVQTFGLEPAVSEGMRSDWNRKPVKPVLNAEPGYEYRHRYVQQKHRVDDWHVRMEAYTSLLMGGCGYTYGHVSIHHFGKIIDKGADWIGAMQAPGANQMRHVRDFIEDLPLFDRVPDQSILASPQGTIHGADSFVAAARDKDFKWAAVYSTRGHPFDLQLSQFSGDPRPSWIDPRTGRVDSAAGGEQADANRRFTPPGTPGRGNDWLLKLEW